MSINYEITFVDGKVLSERGAACYSKIYDILKGGSNYYSCVVYPPVKSIKSYTIYRSAFTLSKEDSLTDIKMTEEYAHYLDIMGLKVKVDKDKTDFHFLVDIESMSSTAGKIALNCVRYPNEFLRIVKAFLKFAPEPGDNLFNKMLLAHYSVGVYRSGHAYVPSRGKLLTKPAYKKYLEEDHMEKFVCRSYPQYGNSDIYSYPGQIPELAEAYGADAPYKEIRKIYQEYLLSKYS